MTLLKTNNSKPRVSKNMINVVKLRRKLCVILVILNHNEHFYIYKELHRHKIMEIIKNEIQIWKDYKS